MIVFDRRFSLMLSPKTHSFLKIPDVFESGYSCFYYSGHIRIRSQPMLKSAKIGVLTVSDRASRGEYEDLGGPAICEYLREVLISPWSPECVIVSDDRQLIAGELQRMADDLRCCLIITTGGTGPAVRDVTPEATEDVCQKLMPGFGELMRSVSLLKVPTAILSRQTAGIRGSSLIVNLPGQPKAIRECLDAVMPAIPYCIDLIDGPRLETNSDRVVTFRPKPKT
jgi:molybdopterin adenylyltransferase